MTNVDEIWEDNHTHLRTRLQDHSDAQKWVLGPEEFHGGKVLRHFRDGRGVDVHGWRFADGGKMGVENSVHATCDGVSYVLQLCDDVVAKSMAVNGNRLLELRIDHAVTWAEACER